jgi:hypothetical protein
MWKMFVPIVTGLGLFLTLPALAQEKSAPLKCSPDGSATQVLELKGVLRHVKGALTKNPPVPFEYWELHTAGKTYYLDLRGKQLLALAEKLVNRPVVVTGIPEPASPTIRVTGIKADEYVKETIQVEIRGKLGSWREPNLIKPLPFPIDKPDPWIKPWPPRPIPQIVTWWIYYDGGKYYELEFGGRAELLKLAKTLDGKQVVVTGTRAGQVIHVASMKVPESDCQEKVSIEIQGVLEGEFIAIDRLHQPLYPSGHVVKNRVLVGWKLTVNGKTYTLDFGGDQKLKNVASQLMNKTVIVTGTLKNGVVTVTRLLPAGPDAAFELACPRQRAEYCA